MIVCDLCFNDSELVTFIKTNSKEVGTCKYCENSNSNLIEFDEIADFFSEFFSIFSPSDKGISIIDLIENDWNLFSANDKGEELLNFIAIELNLDLNSHLKVEYVEQISECVSYWETLKEELKWSRRFLTDLENIRELRWDEFFYNKQVQLNEELFRGRIHKNSGEAPFDVSLMGCPQKHTANSGRANPQGIPYLYLSKSYETTFYEIRAAYLDEISVGKFRVKAGEVVVLVDFTEQISAFLNQDKILWYTKSVLLKKKISGDLSKPLRRYDTELEYIPTQFICEFIRYITDADGIIFNSSLHIGGKNVVLFAENKMECIEVVKYQINHVNISGEKV